MKLKLNNDVLVGVLPWMQRNDAVQLIADKIKSVLPRTLRGPGMVQLRILVANLYLVWKNEGFVGLPFGSRHFHQASAFHKAGLRKSFSEIASDLVKSDFIENHGGHVGVAVSQCRPSAKLIEIFEFYQCDSVICDHEESERYIVVHDCEPEDGRKRLKELDLDLLRMPADILARDSFLRDYNRLLARSVIDLPNQNKSYVTVTHGDEDWGKTTRISIRPGQKVMSKFCRASYECGGRFYGHWSQHIPSERRTDIYIDDKPTNEIDFSGHHVRLAYALQGLTLEGDAYEIEGFDRSLVKALVLIAFNAKGDKSAFAAFRNEADCAEHRRMKNSELAPVLAAIRKKHAPIADAFCSDMGVRLQRIDSDISEYVLRAFTARGIPCLCVHDSFIVPAEHADGLEKAMRVAFNHVLKGGRCEVKVTKGNMIPEEEISGRYRARLARHSNEPACADPK